MMEHDVSFQNARFSRFCSPSAPGTNSVPARSSCDEKVAPPSGRAVPDSANVQIRRFEQEDMAEYGTRQVCHIQRSGMTTGHSATLP